MLLACNRIKTKAEYYANGTETLIWPLLYCRYLETVHLGPGLYIAVGLSVGAAINYASVPMRSEVYGSVCVCVCVECYSCSMLNEVQVRVSIGF